MLLRRFSTEDLASELAARGFDIFPRGATDGVVRASIVRPAHYVDRVVPDKRESFAAHWRLQVAEHIAVAMAKGGGIVYSERRDGENIHLIGEALVKRAPPVPDTPVASVVVPAESTGDPRPTNCRMRLAKEGKQHPKSGCAASGCGGVFAPACYPRSRP